MKTNFKFGRKISKIFDKKVLLEKSIFVANILIHFGFHFLKTQKQINGKKATLKTNLPQSALQFSRYGYLQLLFFEAKQHLTNLNESYDGKKKKKKDV